jgi:hypothetical protein
MRIRRLLRLRDAIALAVATLLSPAFATSPPAPSRAMWVYETEALLGSPAARDELFEFCRTRRISDLFWQMHFEGETKAGPYQIRPATALADFLGDASRRGIRVHALAGDPSHALTRNHERVLARVDAVLAFNKRQMQSSGAEPLFHGLHLDIEPHGLPEWKTASEDEKCRLLTQFVELNAKVMDRIRAAETRTTGTRLAYGADIAFWLDKTRDDGSPAYPVTFRGVTQDATKHLLDMLDNVALMSYRNKAEGRNGLIALARRAIDDAGASRGRVFVGVKMADIGPKAESFFGSTEQEMEAELRKVEKAFSQSPGYAGLAFFMYAAYRKMPQQGK